MLEMNEYHKNVKKKKPDLLCYNSAALIRLCSSTELQRSLTDKIPTNRKKIKINPPLYHVVSVHFY